MDNTKKFYRYEAKLHSSYGIDMNGEFVPSIFPPTVNLELQEYNLHKETPKGYWIGYGFNDGESLRSKSTWVSKTSKKRYAYPTKEEALIGFIKRTEKRAEILKKQLDMCKTALHLAKNKSEVI